MLRFVFRLGGQLSVMFNVLPMHKIGELIHPRRLLEKIWTFLEP